MISSSVRANWCYLFSIPLLMLTYLIAFLSNNGFALWTFATVWVYVTFIFVGLIFSFVLVWGNKAVRIALVAAVLAIFIALMASDGLQAMFYAYTSCLLTRKYLALIIFSVLIPIVYALYAKLDKFVFTMGLTFLLSLIFLPNVPLSSRQVHSIGQTNSSLPPYIHIVLDEHIGFGAMREDPVHYFYAPQLKSKYIARGFRLYSNAYARDLLTIYSFSDFLNFKGVAHLAHYLSTVNPEHHVLKKNAVFKLLSNKAYKLNVVQSAYLDFCQAENVNVSQCTTYRFAGLTAALYHMPIFAQYISILNAVVPHVITNLSLWQRMLWTTQIKAPILSPASASLDVFPEVIQMLKNAQPGNAYFIHLLMPHVPFVYDQDCHFVGEQKDKVSAYSNQIQCIQKKMDSLLNEVQGLPVMQKSIIVIQGDHGVRAPDLDAKKSYLSEDKDNIRTMYSAFFVVRAPFISAGDDLHELPLDYLLQSILEGHEPLLPYDPKKQYIFLRTPDLDLGRHVMPSFNPK